MEADFCGDEFRHAVPAHVDSVQHRGQLGEELLFA